MLMRTSFLLFLFLANVSFAGVDVNTGQAVGYVYQVDTTDPTLFEFHLPDRTNICNSTSYRSKSDNEQVASRKFSMVLSALMSDKKITFHETGDCESGRALVGWIRLHN